MNRLKLFFSPVYERRLLIVLFVIGLTLRSAFAIYKWNEQNGANEFVDAWDYIEYAKVIMEDGPFPTELSKIRAFSPPGFPWLLAIIFSIFGVNFFVPIALNVLLSTSLILLVYHISKACFNRHIGIMAAIWTTFYVKFYEHMADVGKEIIHYVSVLLCVIVFKYILENRSYKSLSIAALFFAIWVHIDERYIGYMPWFIICYLVFNKFHLKFVKQAGAFIILFVVLQVPWTIRNYHAYERFVFLTERIGLITDRFQGTIDQNSLYTRKKSFIDEYERIKETFIKGEEPVIESSRQRQVLKGLNMGYEPYTFGSARVKWENFKYLWQPVKLDYGFIGNGWKFKGPWSIRNNILTMAVYGILLPFLLISLYLMLKNRNKWLIFLWGIILSHTLIHVFIAHGNPRYRIPIDSLIIILSMYSIYSIYCSMKVRLKKG